MSQYIEHRHDKGVEIYHFNSVSRAAIDEFYTIAMPIFKAHVDVYQATLPLFYVLDLTETGMFPVKYMMDKAIKEMRVYEHQPQHYIAYVTSNPQDQMLINILEQLTARNLAHTCKVYTPDKLAESIAWLQTVRASFVETS